MPVSPYLVDPFFRQFFEHLRDEDNVKEDSLGSGVIVSKEGLVLTNFHVIENANVVKVVLANKREYPAKLLTVDKRTDLALLKIEDHDNFPFLEVKSDDNLEVGDVVLAIGNPFGVGQTVTSGIVSALARSQEGINDFRTFIQTDAAINPGNSGGALITTDGRLVGINTAIYSKSGGSLGIGFAVPINLAIPVIESVEHGGKIIRPWVGLKIQALSPEDAQALELDHPYGVLVRDVYPGGPADQGGIKAGDVLLKMDGKEIDDDSRLDYLVGTSPIGKTVIFSILRKGASQDISVVLSPPLTSKNDKPLKIKGRNPLQGAQISEISPALALEMGLNPWQKGVVITELSPTDPVGKLGLHRGDILEMINDHKVLTPEDVLNLLENSSNYWSLVVRRGKKTFSIQVTG
jgi:Do/DeqQ family serine protease